MNSGVGFTRDRCVALGRSFNQHASDHSSKLECEPGLGICKVSQQTIRVLRMQLYWMFNISEGEW